ncbi:hypothetical protein FXW07_05985 [Methanosarcina sp. DH1]|uniref:hypothetical protein n=1 Tax=Methanosarcina sp. DH1 TaxID=2605695 RepID=UPI001E444EFD|nr:hypothetical protein [Methanosarcina sp. DH1]MCC4766176.1 hypothetical protein [Methanosarcina sp. DH1]
MAVLTLNPYRKLNLMQRCVDYLKSIDSDSSDLESNYEKRSAVEKFSTFSKKCS